MLDGISRGSSILRRHPDGPSSNSNHEITTPLKIGDSDAHLQLLTKYLNQLCGRPNLSQNFHTCKTEIEAMMEKSSEHGELSSKNLAKIIHLLRTISGHAPDEASKNILSEFAEPLKVSIFNRELNSLAEGIAVTLKRNYNKPGDFRIQHLSGDCNIPIAQAFAGAIRPHASNFNLVSDTNALVSIRNAGLSIAGGIGDPQLFFFGLEAGASFEQVTGFETIPRYSRDLAWQDISDKLRSIDSNIFNTNIEVMLRGSEARTRDLHKELNAAGIVHQNSLDVPIPQWNFPFKLNTSRVRFGLTGRGVNNMLHVDADIDIQKGQGFYHSGFLLDSLLLDNGNIYSQQAKDKLPQPVLQLDRKLDKICQQERSVELATTGESLKESICNQIEAIENYFQVVNIYDKMRFENRRSSSSKDFRAKKKLVEQANGVRGRDQYIQKATLLFAKTIHQLRRIKRADSQKTLALESFLKNIEDKYDLFNQPPIHLTNRGRKYATRLGEICAARWDRKTFKTSVNLSKFGISGSIRLAIVEHRVPHWGIPELEGNYCEIIASVNVALNAPLAAKAAAFAANKAIDIIRKKHHHNLYNIRGELQDTLRMLDTQYLPTAGGGEVISLFQESPTNRKYHKLYTRIMLKKGHSFFHSAGLPGAGTLSMNLGIEDGKNLKEYIGTSTLKFVWRQFSGLINNKNYAAWNRFVERHKNRLRELIINTGIANHPAEQSYQEYISKIEEYVRYGDPSISANYTEKKQAFETSRCRLADNPSDDQYLATMKDFQELFELYLKTVWLRNMGVMYKITLQAV